MRLDDFTLHDATYGDAPQNLAVADELAHLANVTDLRGDVLFASVGRADDLLDASQLDASQLPAVRIATESIRYDDGILPYFPIEGRVDHIIWIIYNIDGVADNEAQRNRLARHVLRALAVPDGGASDATATTTYYSQPDATTESTFGFRHRIRYWDYDRRTPASVTFTRTVTRGGVTKQLDPGFGAIRIALPLEIMNNPALEE